MRSMPGQSLTTESIRIPSRSSCTPMVALQWISYRMANCWSITGPVNEASPRQRTGGPGPATLPTTSTTTKASSGCGDGIDQISAAPLASKGTSLPATQLRTASSYFELDIEFQGESNTTDSLFYFLYLV